MPESERTYAILDRIEQTVNTNHTEVLQRLTTLEAIQHTPDTCPAIARMQGQVDAHQPERCPGNARTEARLDDHLKDHKQREEERRWRDFAKDMVKIVAGAVTGGVIGSQIK